MRKRRWRFDGWPSLLIWAMAVTACDPTTPRPGSGRAPVDAAIDRGFLGVGGEGGSGGSSAGPTTPSKGGTAGVGVPLGTVDAGGSSASTDGGVRDGTGTLLDPDAGATDATRDGGRTWAGGRTGGLGPGDGGSGGESGTGGGATRSDAGGPGGRPVEGGGGGPPPGGGGGERVPPPVGGELAITELLINPTGTDTGREWIEILNRAAHPVDLGSVHVADAANDAPVDFAILAGAAPVLPTGARTVLIQSADPAKNGGITLGDGGLVPVGGAFGTRVSLNNEADTISLCAGPCADGVLLDRVAWTADLGAAYEGHALSIDDRGRRCPAAVPFGDAGSFGTPGAPNAPCP